MSPTPKILEATGKCPSPLALSAESYCGPALGLVHYFGTLCISAALCGTGKIDISHEEAQVQEC